MGLLRWLRGGDGDASATSMVSAGLAEIDGLFRPSKHKQTEHVEQMKRKRIDVNSSAGGIDFDRGTVTIRGTRPQPPAEAAGEPDVLAAEPAGGVAAHEESPRPDAATPAEDQERTGA